MDELKQVWVLEVVDDVEYEVNGVHRTLEGAKAKAQHWEGEDVELVWVQEGDTWAAYEEGEDPDRAPARAMITPFEMGD